MSRKTPHYTMPVEYAKSYIPNIYQIAQQFSKGGVYKAESPAIARGIRDLLKKVKNLPGKGDFQMTYGDCALLCGIMIKVKSVLHFVYPSLKKEEEEGTLTEEGRFNLKFNQDLQKSIDDIMEDMCETFPDFIDTLTEYRKSLHETDLLRRRMSIDNETVILHFRMKEEVELRFLHLIFQCFFYLIIKSDYNFSESVREADFFYLSDFKEVFAKVQTAAREGMMTIDITLRDAIVIYMVSNITQKLYFTDAGEEFMNVFNKVSAEKAVNVSGIELRNLYLRVAAQINEAIERIPKDEETFASFIKPVKEFAI